MELPSLQAMPRERCRNPTCPTPRSTKDQHPPAACLLVKMKKQVDPITRMNQDYMLGHMLNRHGVRVGLDSHRASQMLVGQLQYVAGHRGAEKQHLPSRRDSFKNTSDLGRKAHVEHPIGFINYQHLHRFTVEGAFIEQLTKPTRRRN
jgi:hypothetical protein